MNNELALMPLTPRAKRALCVAQKFARESDHAYIGTEHLLIAVFESAATTQCAMLESCGVDAKVLFPALLAKYQEFFPFHKEKREERARKEELARMLREMADKVLGIKMP